MQRCIWKKKNVMIAEVVLMWFGCSVQIASQPSEVLGSISQKSFHFSLIQQCAHCIFSLQPHAHRSISRRNHSSGERFKEQSTVDFQCSIVTTEISTSHKMLIERTFLSCNSAHMFSIHKEGRYFTALALREPQPSSPDNY